MKKITALVLCAVLILSLGACGKSDLPTVSIPTDDEINSMIGEYQQGSSAEAQSGESSSASGSAASSGSESSGSSSSQSSSGGLKPNISSGADSSDTTSPAVSEDGHTIMSIITPFIVSDEVIAEGKKNGSPPNPRPTELVCTISVSCKTAINTGVNKNEGFTHLPSDGWILAPTKVSYSEGDTVFTVLAKLLQDNGIQMEYTGMGGLQYVKGIDNLYEFDGGRWSGWMYCVNGWYPNFGCGQYTIDPGDVIEWNYTCDLGVDLGQAWLGG